MVFNVNGNYDKALSSEKGFSEKNNSPARIWNEVINMKKKVTLVFICLLALTSVGFAQDFEVGGTFLFNKSTDTLFGGGLNLGYSSYFTEMVGYGVYGNLMLAVYDRKLLFITDTLIGISFKFIENDKFSLPIAIGPYIDRVFVSDYSGLASLFNFGVGGNITAKIKINEKTKLYARLQGAYTFFGGGEIWITPSIGGCISF
jgi:hypothetical protein